MRHVTDEQRRHRLARRHAIAPGHRVADPVAATRAMTVLHATEPATVHLAVVARVDGVKVADIDRALQDDRTLVKQLAMRRTLFVFPRDLLPAAWGSASARVALTEWKRVVKDVEASGLAEDGNAWLEAACAAVLARLADAPDGLPAQALREQVPEMAGTVTISPGTKWGGDVPIGPRVLTQLGCRAEIVRGRNAGHWRLSRPAWTLMADWLGERPAALAEPDGYAELVRRWLATFGPGTTRDVQWWLGATVTATKRALADVGAVEVSLDGGGTGWVLPDDLDDVEPVAPWAALLPVLDPSTMGWKERDFHLPPEHTPYLFDSNGNGGTTAWWEGRIVGCWVQDDDGVVRVVLREDIGAEGRAALDVEAGRLTGWLDGVRVNSVYTSLQMKSALLP
jgi:DNA glycosylase AlkZ-like